MQNITAGIVLEDRAATEMLRSALIAVGIRVLALRSIQVARRVRLPDVWLIGVREAAVARRELIDLLKTEEGRAIPAVALVGAEDRREALSLGLSTHIILPCDPVELKLVLQAVLGISLEDHKPKPITGDLSTVQLSELMTMFYSESRTVKLTLKSPQGAGQVVLHRGDIIKASTNDGLDGDGAVETMLSWQDGTFSAQMGTDSIDAVASQAFDAPAPPPASPSPAPASPPAAEQSRPAPKPSTSSSEHLAHDALALLNTLYCYIVAFVEPAVATRKLEATRQVVARREVALELFEVQDEGMLALSASAAAAMSEVDQEALVRGVAEWILAFRIDIDQSFPGTVPFGVMRVVADAASSNLEQIGLLRALGIDN
ncbi:MAG: DUF4388 domain-containing protein [Myxococcota bacterium]